MRLALLFLLAACERAPLDDCPDVAAGELTIGRLSPTSIELRAGARPLELAGLRLELTRLDGSGARAQLIHAPTPMAAGGSLVVEARVPAAGVLDLWACEEHVARASWRSLP